MGENLDQSVVFGEGDGRVNGGPPTDPPVFSDVPLEEAAEFNFDPIVETLRTFIRSTPRNAPFNICLSGGWGTGKTTLLKNLERSFENWSESDAGAAEEVEYVPVWFAPWRLSSEKEVRDALARTVLRKIEEDSDFLTGADMQIERRNVIRVLSERLFKVNPDELSTFYRAEARLEGTFAEVEDIFKRVAKVYLEGEGEGDVQRRLIVFVDDLDRCQPALVTKMLESVKLFFDLPGLVFVFALDYQQIERAVKSEYKMEVKEAREYMEKIFQVKIDLPPKGATELREYLAGKLQEVGVELGSDGVYMAIVEQFGHNLRNLKRFINWFNFERQLISKVIEIDDDALFRWLYLYSTMTHSMKQASASGLANLALALEFLAHGGFLHDPETQARYLDTLEAGDMNYLALIAYSIVAEVKDDVPSSDLSYAQRQMVQAIREDGSLVPTLKVIREGEGLLIDIDLKQVIYLTGSASEDESAGIELPPHELPPVEKVEAPLAAGNPLGSNEWNKLGDDLIKASNVGAYVSYLMATLMAPESGAYLVDLARAYRRGGSYDAIRKLHHHAYALEPTSPYVLAEISQFHDVVIKDEELGSLLYRRLIAQGMATPSAPYYLSMNLQKEEGREAEAYLACLDAVIHDPDSEGKRTLLAGRAKAAGIQDRSARRPVEELRVELEEAVRAGAYPLTLTPQEEAQVDTRLKQAPDEKRAGAQLSRPPF